MHVDMVHRFTADVRRKDRHNVGTVQKLVLNAILGRFPNKGNKDVENRLHRFLKYCRKLQKTAQVKQVKALEESAEQLSSDVIDMQMADDEGVDDDEDVDYDEDNSREEEIINPSEDDLF